MDKKTKILAVFYLALAFLLIFGTATAADTTVTFAGEVVDESGNPVEGARLELFDPVNSEFYEFAYSDPGGHFMLSVEPGTYFMEVLPPEGSDLGRAIEPERTIDK